jgi:hypothetical protein
MRKIIKLNESDLELIIKKVLQEQSNIVATAGSSDYKKDDINPKNLKIGSGGRKNPKQVEDVKKLQSELIRLGFLKLSKGPTGYFGPITQDSLNKYKVSTGKLKKQPDVDKKDDSKNIDKKDDSKKIDKKLSYPCVGLPKDKCSKVSSTSVVKMGSAGTTQCAQYVTKCLTEYDQNYYTGNAWKAASIAKGQGGKEKFNLFTSSINWDSLWNEIKKNKITKSECDGFYGSGKSDFLTFNDKKKKLLSIIKSSVPESSNVSMSQLQVGDIVGLWHDETNNKGRAFCERMIDDLKFDEKGNFKQLPFTFNTHVGFVTTIKDGIPIIAHNVDGTYYTVPATQMLSKKSPDMIAWVITDPQVQQEIAKREETTIKGVPSYYKNKVNP